MACSIALEVERDSATLHLRGLLGTNDVRRAHAACAQLPDDVQVLRVTLHGVSIVDAGARQCITALIREWRARSGQIVLSVTPGDLESLTERRAEIHRGSRPTENRATATSA